MKRLFIFVLAALLISACSKDPGVPMGVPSAPTSSDCWSSGTKSVAQSVFEKQIVTFLAQFKGNDVGLDEVAASPRAVVLNDFSVQSFDEKSGHLLCGVSISTTIQSKRYGTIVVPAVSSSFDIMQGEKGPELSVDDKQMSAFWDGLAGQLHKNGIEIVFNIVDDAANLPQKGK